MVTSQPVCRGSVVWVVTSTTVRTACSEIIRIYPGRGACFNPARRNAETALAAAVPLGRKSSFFGDLPTQDAISGYLDNSGVSHQLQGEELSVGSGGGICTHRDSTMRSGHPTHMDKLYRSYITDETVKVRA